MSAVPPPERSGNLPDMQSFIRLLPENLVISAIKTADRGSMEDLIIRFYEAEGKACTASVRLAAPILSAYMANLLEENQTPLRMLSESEIAVDVVPYEIKTLRLALQANRGRPVRSEI